MGNRSNSSHQCDLPLVDGSYEWADGKSVSVYDSTVVALHTDAGIVGCNPHPTRCELHPTSPFF